MFFTKYPSAANFVFAQAQGSIGSGESVELNMGKRPIALDLASFEGSIHRIRLTHHQTWLPNLSLCELNSGMPVESDSISWEDGSLVIEDEHGELALQSVPNRGLGVNAEASLFQFLATEENRYFGMGEKNFDTLELSGKRTVFWNTDVWSDFHIGQYQDHPADPSYFSIPYLAVKLPNGRYVGLLLNNPAPAFMETPGRDGSRAFLEWQQTSPHLILGSYDGQPELWVITADTLPELTSKLNRLVGTTPLPPLWSLGYHQSRWGYGGDDDLYHLDSEFTKHGIPCSGLWLDLDYMDGYRIFRYNQSLYPNGIAHTAAALAKTNRCIVPIIDPGVKSEPGYHVYDDGMKQAVFCENREGEPYIGMVWPGETVFPDFMQPRVRDWWATYAAGFRKEGFGACWVDMNDPSTGPMNPNDMLFHSGRDAHWLHRNQYALGMQMATHQGFLEAKPEERPFILSRSGSVGSSRYAAIWTGDNVANDFWLKLSILTTMSMGLSGHVFTGADVGGFGEDTNPLLMQRWIQASFLMPFMRNHSTAGTRQQEPWALRVKTREIAKHYIRLRYRLTPYLYNLFAQHEQTGEPIARPLMYHYDDPRLAEVSDQVMVGPWLMQAPILAHGEETRAVILPGKKPWFDLTSGEWVPAGRYVVAVGRAETPAYLASGAIVPMQAEMPLDEAVDLTRPTFLIAVTDGAHPESQITYVADDGISFAYREGARSEMKVKVKSTMKRLDITWEQTSSGFGDLKPTFVITPRSGAVYVNGVRARQRRVSEKFTGRAISFRRLE